MTDADNQTNQIAAGTGTEVGSNITSGSIGTITTWTGYYVQNSVRTNLDIYSNGNIISGIIGNFHVSLYPLVNIIYFNNMTDADNQTNQIAFGIGTQVGSNITSGSIGTITLWTGYYIENSNIVNLGSYYN